MKKTDKKWVLAEVEDQIIRQLNYYRTLVRKQEAFKSLI